MDIIFDCPKCEQELAVDSSGAGSEINCPSCGEKIVIPQASSLMKQFARYGYAPEARPNALTKALLMQRVAYYGQQTNQLWGQYNRLVGAQEEAQALTQAIEGQERGADIVMMPST